jgi:hypothetical protein
MITFKQTSFLTLTCLLTFLFLLASSSVSHANALSDPLASLGKRNLQQQPPLPGITLLKRQQQNNNLVARHDWGLTSNKIDNVKASVNDWGLSNSLASQSKDGFVPAASQSDPVSTINEQAQCNYY